MLIQQRTFGAAILRAPDDAAASGPLTIDAAVAALSAKPDDAPAADEAGPEPDNTPDDSADDGEAGQDTQSSASPEADDADPDDEVDVQAGEADAEGEQPQPLDPPHFWAADDKAAFEALPRHLQEKVLAYEKNRDTAASTAIQQANESRKQADQARQAAEQQASALAAKATEVDKLAERASLAFASKWPEVINWPATLNQLIQEHGHEAGHTQYLLLKEEHAADVQEMQRLEAAKQDLAEQAAKDAKEREEAEFKAFVAEEYAKLATVEPELADPKHGAERRQKVAQFLVSMGVSAEQIRHAGAVEYALAYDAMRYRDAKAAAGQAARDKRPPSTPAARPQTPQVRPTAAQPAVAPQQRAAAQAQNRFAQKPTMDNAAAAILALKG